MPFKMAQDVRNYFSNIMNTGGSHGFEDKSKFLMFDPYYCCAIIGMAACEIDTDESDYTEFAKEYPMSYRNCKAYIAGLLVASEAKRKGIDIHNPKMETTMLEYLTNADDTLLTDAGMYALNAYSRRGVRIYQELFPDKPNSREEFLLGFNLAIQMYCK